MTQPQPDSRAEMIGLRQAIRDRLAELQAEIVRAKPEYAKEISERISVVETLLARAERLVGKGAQRPKA
jgi:uncharacterized protein YdhG (YjbR/CyaY superfamily)